jgi:hypothetical protein
MIDPSNPTGTPSASPAAASSTESQPTPSDDWKQLAYEMAWAQYSHEDDLAQTRTNVSLTIQAAILALLAGLAAPVLEIGERPLLGLKTNLGLGIYSLLAIIAAVLALRLVRIWSGFAAAGEQYMNLRLQAAFAIEQNVGLSKLGPASREHMWKKQRLTDELPAVELPLTSGQPMGGWESLLATTKALRALWLAVLLSASGSLGFVALDALTTPRTEATEEAVPPNPSLQRTSPGHSPGRHR